MASGYRIVFLLVIVFFPCKSVIPQEWETYLAEDFNILFKIPPGWVTYVETEGDIPFLESVSSDESTYMMIYSYDKIPASAQELASQALIDLGVAQKGDITQQKIDDMDACIIRATGVLDEVNAGLYIVGATFNTEFITNNYLVYIVTEEPYFDKNKEVMMQIINSMQIIAK